MCRRALAGEQMFRTYGCITCHASMAPTLAGLYGRPVQVVDDNGKTITVTADEAYLRESILDPAAKLVVGYPNRMPSFKGELSEEQLMQLIEYIKSLSGAADTGPYDKKLEQGPTTQPTPFQPMITNPLRSLTIERIRWEGCLTKSFVGSDWTNGPI